jgi:hypothetical protein
MPKIKYSSNNSGGNWWLKDEDWLNLASAGWNVEWVKDSEQHQKYLGSDDRWLGALATSASKEFDSEKDAIYEWEKVTGQNADDEGCACCGQPHNFWER